IFLFLIGLFFCCLQNSKHLNPPTKTIQTYFINSDSGLKMRIEPDQKSKTIHTIFNGEEIIILEEKTEKVIIDNIENSWVKIQNKEKIGWVFKGYLSEKNPYIGKYKMKIVNYAQCKYPEFFLIEENNLWEGTFFIGGDEGDCGYTDINGTWYLKQNQICFKIKEASSSHDHFYKGIDPCYYLQKNTLYAVNDDYAFKENFGSTIVSGIKKTE
ncbi:MAG TPA: SH3 domain-containing protein, partial [Leptospiraceae bacterium]|nr:SH3 domain-containing protein [Leptospiraceae bacterium]